MQVDSDDIMYVFRGAVLVKLSAGQKTLGLLCRPKFCYPVHQSLPVDLIVSQVNPLHTFTHQSLKVPVVLPLTHISFQCVPLGFPTNILYAF
jgi:hypothetical protein